jgi:hypothetical protein
MTLLGLFGDSPSQFPVVDHPHPAGTLGAFGFGVIGNW